MIFCNANIRTKNSPKNIMKFWKIRQKSRKKSTKVRQKLTKRGKNRHAIFDSIEVWIFLKLLNIYLSLQLLGNEGGVYRHEQTKTTVHKK